MKRPSRRPKREDEGEAPPGLSLERFPEVPAESRPREIVFDSLAEVEYEALRRRGYRPVLLRVLPRRNPVEDRDYMIWLMRGVAEGTVEMTKSRAEGLNFELKARGWLTGRGLDMTPGSAKVDASVEAVLSWGESRHAFTGNTTIVPSEVVAAYEREVQAAAQKRQPLTKRKRRKKDEDDE